MLISEEKAFYVYIKCYHFEAGDKVYQYFVEKCPNTTKITPAFYCGVKPTPLNLLEHYALKKELLPCLDAIISRLRK